jgi:hypothetical protein
LEAESGGIKDRLTMILFPKEAPAEGGEESFPMDGVGSWGWRMVSY